MKNNNGKKILLIIFSFICLGICFFVYFNVIDKNNQEHIVYYLFMLPFFIFGIINLISIIFRNQKYTTLALFSVTISYLSGVIYLLIINTDLSKSSGFIEKTLDFINQNRASVVLLVIYLLFAMIIIIAYISSIISELKKPQRELLYLYFQDEGHEEFINNQNRVWGRDVDEKDYLELNDFYYGIIKQSHLKSIEGKSNDYFTIDKNVIAKNKTEAATSIEKTLAIRKNKYEKNIKKTVFNMYMFLFLVYGFIIAVLLSFITFFIFNKELGFRIFGNCIIILIVISIICEIISKKKKD